MRGRRPSVLLILFAELLAASAAGQNLAVTIERLRREEERGRAVTDLARAGAPGFRALAKATHAAVLAHDPDALAFAAALAELPGSGSAVAVLLETVPRATPPVRDHLLHALGNSVHDAEGHLRDDVVAALQAWAAAGLCYSPSAERPSFAWYEYVRLRRRLTVIEAGTDPAALLRTLATVRAGRETIAGMMAIDGPTPPDQICNLGRFGQHGTREEIEAIAQLALAAGPGARAVAAALAEYLAHERPCPGVILTESCAGIGEAAPVALPAQQFPTRWRRDDWRFACARAVFALATDPAQRRHALRHLLCAPGAHERIDALAALRAWPAPWPAFAPELEACLDHPDRGVVREALVTLGLADAATIRAVSAELLARLAGGKDRELAALAHAVARRRKEQAPGSLPQRSKRFRQHPRRSRRRMGVPATAGRAPCSSRSSRGGSRGK